ncbi:hypothetical protein [Nocardiopsis synnemataformans]|uniref:hypothetical protein n=1 Tax=Nocardiopsis synnemataformans TaxID=61305 RepID=UPI003EBF8144
MNADHEEPYIQASFDVLKAAVRHEHGIPGAVAEVEEAFERLSGTTNILAHMSGWAGAVAHVEPAFTSRTATLGSVSSRTGRHVNPDGKVPTGALIGSRLAVALLNDHIDTCIALWQSAIDHDAQGEVVRTVLRHMALLIAPHISAEEARADA